MQKIHINIAKKQTIIIENVFELLPEIILIINVNIN